MGASARRFELEDDGAVVPLHDLVRRVHEHKQGAVDGFTRTYGVKTLVFFEGTDDVRSAIQRERTMKHWSRAWKIAAIEKTNPDWRDLYDDIVR